MGLGDVLLLLGKEGIEGVGCGVYLLTYLVACLLGSQKNIHYPEPTIYIYIFFFFLSGFERQSLIPG